MLFDPVGEAG